MGGCSSKHENNPPENDDLSVFVSNHKDYEYVIENLVIKKAPRELVNNLPDLKDKKLSLKLSARSKGPEQTDDESMQNKVVRRPTKEEPEEVLAPSSSIVERQSIPESNLRKSTLTQDTRASKEEEIFVTPSSVQRNTRSTVGTLSSKQKELSILTVRPILVDTQTDPIPESAFPQSNKVANNSEIIQCYCTPSISIESYDSQTTNSSCSCVPIQRTKNGRSSFKDDNLNSACSPQSCCRCSLAPIPEDPIKSPRYTPISHSSLIPEDPIESPRYTQISNASSIPEDPMKSPRYTQISHCSSNRDAENQTSNSISYFQDTQEPSIKLRQSDTEYNRNSKRYCKTLAQQFQEINKRERCKKKHKWKVIIKKHAKK